MSLTLVIRALGKLAQNSSGDVMWCGLLKRRGFRPRRLFSCSFAAVEPSPIPNNFVPTRLRSPVLG
jgi:hypothetical protein